MKIGGWKTESMASHHQVLHRGYGDVWICALPDRANTWTVTEAGLSDADLASPVAEGTLPDFHYLPLLARRFAAAGDKTHTANATYADTTLRRTPERAYAVK